MYCSVHDLHVQYISFYGHCKWSSCQEQRSSSSGFSFTHDRETPSLDRSCRWCFPGGLPYSPRLALRVGEVFSIRVPSLSLCLKRHNLQGSWFDYVCWMAGGSDELVRPQRWILFLVPTWCPATLLTRLLLEFDGGDGLVADSPPLRQVVPVYRLPVAGEAFLAPHLTWPVM